METINDYSFGVVPVQKVGDAWKVFLIHQIPRRGSLFWTFPKGHPEEGESHEETALRELREETGLVPDIFKKDVTFTQEYTFIHDGQSIEKKVVYYLGVISTAEFQIQIDEIHEAKWCTFAEARVLLTHDIAKQLLDEVAAYLADNNSV